MIYCDDSRETTSLLLVVKVVRKTRGMEWIGPGTQDSAHQTTKLHQLYILDSLFRVTSGPGGEEHSVMVN